VAVSVGVREKAGLEDRVGRRLDTRDHVRGVESGLLDLGKVVLPKSDPKRTKRSKPSHTLAFSFRVNFPIVRRGYSAWGQMWVRSKMLIRFFSHASSACSTVIVCTCIVHEGYLRRA
jgi:hypothetical protein